jgi:hypothetical protein
MALLGLAVDNGDDGLAYVTLVMIAAFWIVDGYLLWAERRSAGVAAEQTVFHLHLHVVPRWDDDGFGRIWPAKGHVAHAEVDDALDRVRRACKP